MNNQENYHTLLLRNQTSLCLDDLVALVVSSIVAEELRTFNRAVMEMTPGFTFTLKQAKALKSEADKTLKGYSRGEITDVDLLTFLSNGKDILRGETLKNGGSSMGSIFDRLIHGKEIKQKEARERLEQRYDDVCKQILECQATMDRCVDECANLDPSSFAYRNNERTYMQQKNSLTLLKKQATELRKTLDEVSTIDVIEKHSKAMQKTEADTQVALGTVAERTKKMERIEAQQQIYEERENHVDFSTSSLLRDDEADEPIVDSEFRTLVTANEVRKFRTASANGTVAEPKAQMSEFDARVAAASEE